MAALTGLMLGSLRKVWPWKAGVNGNDPALPATLDSEVVVHNRDHDHGTTNRIPGCVASVA